MLTKHIQRIITNRTLKVGTNKIITPHSFRRSFATTEILRKEKVKLESLKGWIGKKTKNANKVIVEKAQVRTDFEKLVHKIDGGDILIEEGVTEQTGELLKKIRDGLKWKLKHFKPITRSAQELEESLEFGELEEIEGIINWYEGFAVGLKNDSVYQTTLNKQLERDKRLLKKSEMFVGEFRGQIWLEDIDADLANISSDPEYSADDKNRVKEILNMVLNKMKKESNVQSKSDAQKWLDKNYPIDGVCKRDDDLKNKGKAREKINELGIERLDLQGFLDLSDFTNLESLYLPYNQLTYLILPENNQIKKLICLGNQFTNLPVKLNPKTLTSLNIRNNKIESDLSIFAQLINLEVLSIEEEFSDNDRFILNPYLQNHNQFIGSLKPLVGLIKLKSLNIGYNGQIDSGLEYLPKSLEKFSCRGTKLVKELETYGKPENDNNYLSLLQLWRKDHQELIAQVQVAPKQD